MSAIERTKVKRSLKQIKGFFINAILKTVLLLKYPKVDTDRRYSKNNTLLHYAAQSSAKKNIKMLLKTGADPNAFNENGHTPLSLGLKTKFSNEESLKLLLLGGANLLIVSENVENSFFGIETLKSWNDLYIAERLVAQLAIHEALGQAIEKHIKVLFGLKLQRLQSCYGDCRESLRKLKRQKIRNNTRNGSEFTMFTILAERPEKVARYIKDNDWPTINNYVATYNKHTMNFYYREAIKQYTQDIVKFVNHREKATQVVRQFTGLDDSYYLVVNQIVDCFSAGDLLTFK